MVCKCWFKELENAKKIVTKVVNYVDTYALNKFLSLVMK
jgi:hypothetical protein